MISCYFVALFFDRLKSDITEMNERCNERKWQEIRRSYRCIKNVQQFLSFLLLLSMRTFETQYQCFRGIISLKIFPHLVEKKAMNRFSITALYRWPHGQQISLGKCVHKSRYLLNSKGKNGKVIGSEMESKSNHQNLLLHEHCSGWE